MKSPKLQSSRDTCTACAGTIILEFAALSRLTGDPIFEEKARQALDCLWSQRHRGSDLVGTVLNVHSGKIYGRKRMIRSTDLSIYPANNPLKGG